MPTKPRFYTFLAVSCVALSLAGCGGEKLPEFGQVTGVVKARGKPQKGLAVSFTPDPGQGNDVPYIATGKTDDQGKYTVSYAFKGNQGPGAAVGWNIVTVFDTRYNSIPQGAPIPRPLFSNSYSNTSTSPLKFEVKPGEQTIDLEVK